jgi:hypothetical protein
MSYNVTRRLLRQRRKDARGGYWGGRGYWRRRGPGFTQKATNRRRKRP